MSWETPFVRVLSLILKVVVFLLLLVFTVKNSDIVTVRYLFDLTWQAPLSMILLLVFAAGALLGLLGCSRHIVRSRRELARLKKTPQPGNP
jgi:lipopolysaccharide assembly protein A